VAPLVPLFVYGSLLPGEIHSSLLADGTHLGPATTATGFRLVELEQYPALIAAGDLQIEGELFEVTSMLLGKLDQLKENGRLFQRGPIELATGQEAQAYLMDEDKLRGRRRLRATDWRKRFAPPGRSGAPGSVFGSWRR